MRLQEYLSIYPIEVVAIGVKRYKNEISEVVTIIFWKLQKIGGQITDKMAKY